MNYKTSQGVELSDDGYTKVTQKKSLGYGWEATLYNNDRLILTQDATGETLSIPPESTQTLRDIIETIKEETKEIIPSKLETYLIDNHQDSLSLKDMGTIIKLAKEI